MKQEKQKTDHINFLIRILAALGMICIFGIFLLNGFHLIPYNALAVSFNNAVLMIGVFLFFCALDSHLSRSSNPHSSSLFSSASSAPKVILAGALTGLFIEFFGAFISGLWWQPFYTYLSRQTLLSAALIFLGTAIFITYILLLPGAYHAVRTFARAFRRLDRENKENRKDADTNKNFQGLFFSLLTTGICLIILEPALILALKPSALARGLLFCLPLLGAWLTLEAIAINQGKRSILKNLADKKYGKVAALFAAPIAIGLLSECLNLLSRGWSYQNFPLPSLAVFGVPLLIILGWIPLVVILLSVFNVLSDEDNVF